jgi:hypothetical protein
MRLLTVVSLFLVCTVAGCSDSGSSSNGKWPPLEGARYSTGKALAGTICSNDDNALNKAMDTAVSHDEEGAEQALQGTVVVVAPHTSIRVLHYDMLRGVVDMRIRSGDNSGAEVYCEVGTADKGWFAKKISDE